MARAVALILGLALFPLAMAMTGGAMMIMDAPSMVIVLAGACLFTVAAHGPGPLIDALVASLNSQPLTLQACHQHRRVLETLRNALCASGAAGFLLGLIAVLGNLADPSHIGPAVAVAMLTTLYAVILAELVIAPLSSALPSRIEPLSSADDSEGALLVKSRGAAIVFVVVLSQASLGTGLVLAL